jgi:starvation-inducible DNA-binding protein
MEKLYKLLSDTQATLFMLFQKTWVYHWNVVGSEFYQFHKVFGDQYETMFEEIDRLTEHMRFLNIKPVPTLTRITEVSHISESNSKLNDLEMVKDLIESNEILVELLKQVAEESETQKSRGTTNLVDDLNEEHGKFIWMLRSFVDKPTNKVQESIEINEEELQIEEN